jgi:NarL family two-component system response regulator LiaR
MTTPIRVFLADDHAIVRKGIIALLATEPDIQVVGEAADGRTAVRSILELKPDVVLMDLMLPELDGIDAIRQTTSAWPEARILVLTSFATNEKVFPAVKAGASGYLLKDSKPEDLIRAIRQVHEGESPLDPAIARMVLQEIGREETIAPVQDPLTAREIEVLRQVARGRSNQEIATDLSVSEATIRTHISHILSKLHLASRTQATLYALREGLASLDDPENP